MMELKTYNEEQVTSLIESQPEGKNTSFLKSSHNLWFRFKNYKTNPPYVLEDDGKPVCLIFATLSKRSRYVNLYEIVTLEGKEGNGYASTAWEMFIAAAYDKGMQRIKLSCTPSSVTWHARNGLVFWAVDPTGSLRSDQPLFRTRREQLDFRYNSQEDASIAFPPDQKIIDKLLAETLNSHGFGKKKTLAVNNAISSVIEYWLRDQLVAYMSPRSLF